MDGVRQLLSSCWATREIIAGETLDAHNGPLFDQVALEFCWVLFTDPSYNRPIERIIIFQSRVDVEQAGGFRDGIPGLLHELPVPRLLASVKRRFRDSPLRPQRQPTHQPPQHPIARKLL